MATAHHRLVDHARHRTPGDRKHTLYAADHAGQDPTEEVTDMLDDPVRDDELDLDPDVLPPHPEPGKPDSTHSQGGRRAAGREIARAFLVSESTAAQRIVRAKRPARPRRGRGLRCRWAGICWLGSA